MGFFFFSFFWDFKFLLIYRAWAILLQHRSEGQYETSPKSNRKELREEHIYILYCRGDLLVIIYLWLHHPTVCASVERLFTLVNNGYIRPPEGLNRMLPVHRGNLSLTISSMAKTPRFKRLRTTWLVHLVGSYNASFFRNVEEFKEKQRRKNKTKNSPRNHTV